MSQQTINTPRDTTIQATNTALGLLGKDASLQDIKAALLQIVAALDPTADDYDDLSNKPQVNGVTLSGNKTSKQLGIRQTIPLTSAQYAQLTSAEKMDVDKDYIITDENATAAPIDDSTTSLNSVWSSYKTDAELDALNSKLAVTSMTSNIASGPNMTSGDKYGYKQGKRYHIELYASTTASLATNAKVGRIYNFPDNFSTTGAIVGTIEVAGQSYPANAIGKLNGTTLEITHTLGVSIENGKRVALILDFFAQ